MHGDLFYCAKTKIFLWSLDIDQLKSESGRGFSVSKNPPIPGLLLYNKVIINGCFSEP